MRVLFIEDEPKTAQAVRDFLIEQGIGAECAFDGQMGLRMAEGGEFDVIVTDVNLPLLNGLELCKKLRAKGSTVPILMLSALSQPEDKVLGLEVGADDYMAKPFDFSELLARIRALSRRAKQKMAPVPKLFFADLEMNLDTMEVWRAGEKITLTPREFSLLEYFIRNNGRVLPKTEISAKVWNIDVEINTNVIEVYVNYLRNKIDRGHDKKLIHTQFGVGYIFKNE